MRLTCPNCGAQYEVPDEVIPETGRDVQCSNCGDTWFQYHPDHLPASADEAEQDIAQAPEPDLPPEDSEPEYDVTPQDDTAAGAQDISPESPAPAAPKPDLSGAVHDAPDDTAEQIQDTPRPAAPQRRELDPTIRDLLRAEAEREHKAREAESGGLETQTEMGLDDQPEQDLRSREARERMARLRGEEIAEDDTGSSDSFARIEEDEHADIDPDSRRNLFPDIDEINSSLDSDRTPRPDTAVAIQTADATPQKPDGFRRGFTLAVLLFALVTLIYAFAPQIAGLHPALEPVMASYATAINGLRISLAQTIASFMG